MKNIFVLPTDKPSRLHNKNGELGNYPSTKLYIEDFKGNQHNSFHIYITNSEKIKEGDWFLNIKSGAIGQHNGVEILLFKDDRKIILTTDPDLIKDGVQAIDDNFLEWFVKNPSCEKVEVRKIGEEWIYNADVPKEEPKPLPDVNWQSEIINKVWDEEESKKPSNFYEKLKEYFENTPREKVLEDWNKSAHLDNVGPTVDEFIENSNEERLKDVAERFYSEQSKTYENAIEPTFDDSRYLVTGFLEGVKSDVARDYWFEKFEEDLKTAYFSGIKTTGEGWNGEYANGNNPSIEEEFQEGFQEWFEQYKKK
jgi:hypothetical protein